eukprot:scaffold4613_cov77-Phaeocystis_antarctica.AAC.6
MPPSLDCAPALPCAAESPNSRLASAKSCGPARPSMSMLPSMNCASAWPLAAASPYSRLASAKSCGALLPL